MDLEEIRRGINQVDEQMKELFLERMQYSARVVEAKKQTKGTVFVPEREQEILRLRKEGVEEELVRECRAFFKQLMGISRTYQYSKLSEGDERLAGLPDEEGKVTLEFRCGRKDGELSSVLNAVVLAGLIVEEMTVSECSAEYAQEEWLSCRLRLAGNFSGMLAKAAVLQILEEMKEAVMLSAEM